MPTIAEDSLGQRGGQFAADEANFEQLMVNILDERDKLLETLRDTQENLANMHIKVNDLSKEKDSLQRQLQANLPQMTRTAPEAAPFLQTSMSCQCEDIGL
ncbi:hypothetical protein AVEN_126765-1 [Araneus ventricosus]|uniref:Uncharacterized protein n=1 Tax=Araneus ventricosus TaxID=182803 RepID=A0A4Y2I036_ARAVE|nr:hypothetical protein AVEN_126765-1 [Araneus ventricosus]